MSRDARPFSGRALLDHPLPETEQRYGERETILYALAVGAALGEEAWDPRHLRFVYERELQALPTLASVLGDPGFWMRDTATGLDWTRLVHGEESVEWMRPLAPAGHIRASNRVVRVEDRGGARGVVFVVERVVRDASIGEPIVRMRTTVFARGNGTAGLEAPRVFGDDAEPPLSGLPARAPDHVVMRATLTSQPLLYRLGADLNPLHADPEAARAAGFERPIMHGMCTFGMAGLLIVGEFCGFDATRLRRLCARFTAPLYPGETVRWEFWREAGELRFRGIAAGREAVVLDRGFAGLNI